MMAQQVANSRICEDLLNQVNYTWNHTPKQDELVLVFKCDSKRNKADFHFPRILEADPKAVPQKTAENSQQMRNRDEALNAKSYLDCSEVRFGDKSKGNILHAEEFASLLSLSNFLEKAKCFKVILVMRKDFLLGDTKESRRALVTCPFFKLYGKDCRRSSFGIVIVSKADKSKSPADGKSIKDLKNEMNQQLKNLEYKIRNQMEDLDMTESEREELCNYQHILSTLCNFRNNTLLLQQDRPWNGNVENLVRLPIPPGYKILKFCDAWLQTTGFLQPEVIWKVFQEDQCAIYFSDISQQLFKYLETQLNKKWTVVLDELLNHVIKELKACPPRSDLFCWLVDWSIEMRSRDQRLEKEDVFTKYDLEATFASLKYPFNKNSKIQQEIQKMEAITQLLYRQSNHMDIYVPLEVKLNGALQKFMERFNSKFMPEFIPKLQQQRSECCDQLQQKYRAVAQNLETLLDNFLCTHLNEEENVQKHKIDVLEEISTMLEKLEVGINSSTSEKVSVQTILELASAVLEMEPRDWEEVKNLEEQHRKIDRLFQAFETEHRACGNHSAVGICQNIKVKLGNVLSDLNFWNHTVGMVRQEMETLVKKIVDDFEKNRLLLDFNMTNLPKKLELVEDVLEKVEQNDFCNIPDFVKFLSTVIVASSSDTSNLLQYHSNLQDFVEKSKVKTEIFKSCYASSVSTIQDRLTAWKNELEIAILLKDRAMQFKYQREIGLGNRLDSFTDSKILQIFCSLVPEHEDVFGFLFSEARKVVKDIIEWAFVVTKKAEDERVLVLTGTFLNLSFLRDYIIYNLYDEIRLLASHTLFIDCDIQKEFRRNFTLSIVSPRVEVVRSVEINLSGVNGSSHRPQRNDSLFSNVSIGQKGLNGAPGMPGSNGGHFTLICQTLHNANLLRVTCRGGDGGDGQAGGDGGNGRNGEDANANCLGGNIDYCRGTPGKPGEEGGHGGAGGLPGFGGTVKLDIMDSSAGKDVTVCVEDGKKGRDGTGGKGGRGGNEGRGYKKVKGWFYTTGEYVAATGMFTGTHGKNGKTGLNSFGQMTCTPKNDKKDGSQILISDYRKFLLSLKNFRDQAEQLLAKLDEKVEMEQLSAKQLATDLKNIEAQFLGETENVSRCLHEHRHFQERLLKYSSFYQEDQLSAQDRILLDLLYAFSLSRVLTLQETQTHAGSQVINLESYFEVITEMIQALSSSNTQLYRQKALEIYNQEVNRKKSNVESYIAKIALPAIEQAKQEIQGKLGDCLKEIEKWKEDIRCEKHLKAMDAEIMTNIQKYHLTTKILFSATNFLDIVGMFVPVMQGICLTVSSGIRIAAKAINGVIPEAPPPRVPIQLPECLLPTGHQMERIFQKTVSSMGKQIQLICQFAQKYNHIQNELAPCVAKWMKTLQQMEQEGVYGNFGALLTDLDFFQGITLTAIEQAACDNSVTFSVDKGHLLANLALLNCQRDNVDMHKAAEDQNINTVFWTQEDVQLESMSNRETSLFHKLVPLINFVVEQQAKGNKDPNTNSKVQRFQMRQILQELKQNITDFTRGLHSAEGLCGAVQKVEEALALLIDLQEETEGLEDSKKLAQVVSALGVDSVNFSNLVNDSELEKIMKGLDFHVKANMFLLDYKYAVKAFKHWVFPFAAKYLPHNSEPEIKFDPTGSKDLQVQELVCLYKEKFEMLKTHLGRYKAMTTDSDAVVFKAEFSKASKIIPPFIVWRGKDWKREIGKLFQGEEIELTADVRKADHKGRAAIKFRKVQLVFKHQFGFNSKQQKDLTRILRENYTVTLTHSGISYYRLLDQFFVMRGNEQQYSYSFDKSAKNIVHEKTRTGDYLLSPYTTWGIKLNYVGKEPPETAVQALEKFKNSVNLELEGDGCYVDEKAVKAKELDTMYFQNLENYYELVK